MSTSYMYTRACLFTFKLKFIICVCVFLLNHSQFAQYRVKVILGFFLDYCEFCCQYYFTVKCLERLLSKMIRYVGR